MVLGQRLPLARAVSSSKVNALGHLIISFLQLRTTPPGGSMNLELGLGG